MIRFVMDNIMALSLQNIGLVILAVVGILFVRARFVELRAARLQIRILYQAIGLYIPLGGETPLVVHANIGRWPLNLSKIADALRTMHIVHMLGHTRMTRYVLYQAFKREVPGFAREFSTLIATKCVQLADTVGAFPKEKADWKLKLKSIILPVVK